MRFREEAKSGPFSPQSHPVPRYSAPPPPAPAQIKDNIVLDPTLLPRFLPSSVRLWQRTLPSCVGHCLSWSYQ
ncbi:hypothetical protein CKAH01_17951 [Colletotrichum kahawae]|uniref:Uncharacterized protein n=1 Tax=Colletotrichum kahawae TaxID=34407 RepID=A0AAE0D5H4_COLKA|nr:hypothetical protein CKAH01_17951 [Colletotrichum kahawae]